MKHTQHSLGSLVVIITLSFVLGTLAPARASATTLSSSSVRSMVQSYFKDAPEMIKVAECESGFRQFDGNGDVLRGGYGDMIGVYQIDESVHRDTALAMGYDIDSFIGNILYTRYLYTQEGVNPWIGCVGNDMPSTPVVAQQTSTTQPQLQSPIVTKKEVEKVIEKKEATPTTVTTLSNFQTDDKETADIIALLKRFRELGIIK